MNLIASVRTVMRGAYCPLSPSTLTSLCPQRTAGAGYDETDDRKVPLIGANLAIILYELVLG